MSVVPPGANGTTKRTGFAGQDWAWASVAAKSTAARIGRRGFMRFLLLEL